MKLQDTEFLTLHRPTDARFRKEVPAVLSYAALREDRSAEILTQIDGQWPFWSALLPVQLPPLRKTQELLAAVTQFAIAIEMQFKFHLACRRPLEWCAQVQPMITTPGHGTFPMGHATQIYAVAYVLKELFAQAMGAVLPGALKTQLNRLAFRMSENRIVAGVHFPVDLLGGQLLGFLIGRLACNRFRQEDIVLLSASNFIAGFWDDLDPHELLPTLEVTTEKGGLILATPLPKCESKILEELWTKAVDEVATALKAGLKAVP